MDRLRPRPVDVLTAYDVKMRPRDSTAQRRRVGEEMHVLTAQPDHLPTPQPRPRHQQHDQPIPRRPAGPQQRDDLLIARPVHRAFHRPQPMTGLEPRKHHPVLRPRRSGKVPIVRHVVQSRDDLHGHDPGGHRVQQEPPDPGQNHIDPVGPAHWITAGPDQHLRAARGPRPPRHMPQPGHEHPHERRGRAPIPARAPRPRQVQRHRLGIRLGRQLCPIFAEPDLPEKRVGLADHSKLVIQHRPVRRPVRQPDPKRTHPAKPLAAQR